MSMQVVGPVLAFALLSFGALSIVVSYGAVIANGRAWRRRTRANESHVGARHISGLWFVATLAAVPALLLAVLLGPASVFRAVAIAEIVADAGVLLVVGVVWKVRPLSS